MPRTLFLALDGLSPAALDILTRDDDRGPAMPFLGRLKKKRFLRTPGLHAPRPPRLCLGESAHGTQSRLPRRVRRMAHPG